MSPKAIDAAPELLVLALLAIGLCGCGRSSTEAGGGERPQLAYVTNGVASFWTIASAGVEAAERDLGVTCDVRMPASDPSDQKRIVEELLARDVDGIAISPMDAANQVELVNEACARTRVITHDSDAPGTDRLCYVGMDNYEAGRMCGRLVEEALPEGGSVMLFIGRLEQDNARKRRQGVIDELLDWSHDPERYSEPGAPLEGERYTILDTRTDQFDRARAKANAEDALSRHPDLGCMVGLFAYNPPACLEALAGAGRLGEVRVVAFDEHDASLQGILDGTVYGTVVQDPYRYGYESVRILAGLARGDESVLPADGFLEIPARVIRRADVQEFWTELQDRMRAAR